MESLDKITSNVPPTSLESAPSSQVNFSYFEDCINAALPSDLKKYYDLGYNYYKVSGSDSVSFLKSFFYLFNDYLKTILKDSSIEVEKQEIATDCLNTILKTIELNFNTFETLLSTLKITKKTFDSNKLFMIIVGYAINNVKKSHRN